MSNTKNTTICAKNKKARYEYTLHDTFECGIVLKGCDVKSIKNGNVDITSAYVRILNGEVFTCGMKVQVLDCNRKTDDMKVDTDYKLLLKRSQINKIKNMLDVKGFSCVITKVYVIGNLIKCEIAIAKGKKLHDKRNTIKERDIKRKLTYY